MALKVIILAAGNGRRMSSDTPKVLHPVGGVPMIERVVNTAKALSPSEIHVIHGNGGSTVHEAMAHLNVNWIQQSKQLGTGHAVLQALPFCDEDDQILVLYGDVPLIKQETLALLLSETTKNGLGLVVTEVVNPTGFGRIIRNEMSNIIAIVEHRDANEQQLDIREINTGILATSASNLKRWLPALKNENSQQEYYLTDIVHLAVDDGLPVGGVMAHCQEEVMGVNDRIQQAKQERFLQRSIANDLMLAGVTIIDPARLDIRGEAHIARDVVLDVNVILEGNVTVGTGSMIGPNACVKNSTIGKNVKILANSVVDGAVIADNCVVGPFARVRPGSTLLAQSKVGNFVETKNITLGEGSKANHLTYLGDAEIGSGVNIGAGTITCNYDGVNKHKTSIGDDVFIGSNTALVAPIAIGAGATVAAGSTLTENAPADKLTISRTRAKQVPNWERPSKKKEEMIPE